jgi:hypothetical protein
MFRPCQRLVAAVACILALYLASAHTKRTAAAFPGIDAHIADGFARNGHYPGEPFRELPGARTWGSWCGGDANEGTLTFGPFAAPVALQFGVGGYPNRPGNALFVEHVATRERVPVATPDVGERWRLVVLALPRQWHGQPVKLVAVDHATAWGGWLAITEPIRGGTGDPSAAFWETLAAWAINGVLLAALWLAAARALARLEAFRPLPRHWLPLSAAGAVAATGYLVFWAYFAHPLFGRVVSVGLLLSAGAFLWRTRSDRAASAELATPARLAVVVGLLYVALLRLFPPAMMDFYTVAQNRFRDGLPGDNTLPFVIAERLYKGQLVKQPLGDWHSSDRPPLQSGWQLLTWPVLATLKIDAQTASGTAAMWLQLTWVAAAYGLLRTLGLSPPRAAGWIAALSLSGFFLQNTIFTWPKLSAGAFTCGAFALWILRTAGGSGSVRTADDAEVVPPSHMALGAVFAALAWLSHGGVAFSLLPLAPWAAWRALRGEWRGWLLAAGVFALVASPWIAYQKFYDPPGNRLLKWHLGGQIPADARGTWETLRANYAALPWREIVDNKRANFALQTHARWPLLFDVSLARARERRVDEFFYAARALTWWLGGLVLLPLVVFRLARPSAAAALLPHAALFLWPVLTLPLWCLLLFQPGSAVVHQGSYAVLLALFVVLSAWFEIAGRFWLAVVTLLQAVTFLTTWCVANPVVNGPAQPLALAFALVGGAGLLAFIVAAYRDAGHGGSAMRTTK